MKRTIPAGITALRVVFVAACLFGAATGHASPMENTEIPRDTVSAKFSEVDLNLFRVTLFDMLEFRNGRDGPPLGKRGNRDSRPHQAGQNPGTEGAALPGHPSPTTPRNTASKPAISFTFCRRKTAAGPPPIRNSRYSAAGGAGR
jgi:hypothetical protein